MFDGMTSAQINEFIQSAQRAYDEARILEETIKGERDLRIYKAITDINGLIGENDGVPALNTIRGVRNYSDEDIENNVALAIRLILDGMEQIALITRDLAEAVA